MWKTIEVDTSLGPVGAIISGVDLSQDLEEEVISEIHQAWLKHHIVFFRDQNLTSLVNRFHFFFVCMTPKNENPIRSLYF